MDLSCLHGKSQTAILCHYDYYCLETVTKQMLFTKITGHIEELNFKRESQRHQSRILKRAKFSHLLFDFRTNNLWYKISFNAYFAILNVG